MKKLVLFIAVLTAFSFASCKKSYTCKCSATGYSGTTSGKATTKKAKEACDNEETELRKTYQDASCKIE
jgi:cytochrome c oxidase assembly protein Cox11